jgi:hypothetical protein
MFFVNNSNIGNKVFPFVIGYWFALKCDWEFLITIIDLLLPEISWDFISEIISP